MLIFKSPQSQPDWDKLFDLRYRVLREPLGKERGSEKTPEDESAEQIMMFEGEDLVGVARIDFLSTERCQVRFVAIESHKQGLGYGKKLMLHVEKVAKEKGFIEIVLHARDYALPFYQGLNYDLQGKSYKLFGVLQHFEMSKKI